MSSIKRFIGFAPEVEIESLLVKNYLRKLENVSTYGILSTENIDGWRGMHCH